MSVPLRATLVGGTERASLVYSCSELLSTITLILLVVPSVALGAIWAIGFAREWRSHRLVPSLRAGVALADRSPPSESITVIVPAHNEQDSIAAVIDSLRRQRGVDLRVVIVLDRCTDGTRAAADAAIGDDPRFSILEVGSCPEGWPGKVNAVWRGARESPAATPSDLLLFLDADLTLQPDCLRAAAALRRDRRLDLVTLLSTLRHRHWFEQLVQPACVMELAYEFPAHKANSPPPATGTPPVDRERSPARPFVNGQFVLVTREAYDRFGGHAALAGDIMEDFALAHAAKRAHLGVGVFPADSLLVAGMHDTWASFVRGWMRIFLAASGNKVRRLRRWAIRLGLACVLLPMLVIATPVIAALLPHAHPWARALATWSACGALAIWGAFLVWSALRQRAPVWSILAHPAAIGVVAWIQWRAARTLQQRRPIAWAGKSYVFQPR